MLKVLAVFDSAAAHYGAPMFVPTAAVGVRAFEDACLSLKSPLAAHPHFYSLHELADYDPNSGKFENLSQPRWLASASQVVQRVISERLKREPELPIKTEMPPLADPCVQSAEEVKK